MENRLSDQIETEYDAYCADSHYNTDRMYAKLGEYLSGIIAITIKEGNYIDVDIVDELTQEVLILVATDKIHSFEKKEARFTTFCAVIAKNKALDYVRKRNRHRLDSFEKMEEEGMEFAGQDIYQNPETLLLRQEYRLHQIRLLKKYLQLIMSQKGKPYRTVGCCYTMVLYHRHHPDSRELSSPKWAYEELADYTIDDSSTRYICEINAWFPTFGLYWGEDFQNGMDEREDNVYISDMIFGEHFKVKDLENWSLRMRNKIKCTLIEQECEL